MEDSIVGNSLNFRGLIYSPINEQGVVYLFGIIAEDLNIRVEGIQQGYPDCTGIRYVGKGRWERVRIEFEYKSGNFDHDPNGCDMIVCWEDDLVWCMEAIKKSYEIMKKAIKDNINTGWFAKTPKEHLEEDLEEGYTEEDEEEKLVEHYEKLNAKEMLFKSKISNGR